MIAKQTINSAVNLVNLLKALWSCVAHVMIAVGVNSLCVVGE